MTWWFELANLMQHLLDEHALPTAFVLLFLEEAGLPPIVPGDFLMMLVGVRAAEHRVPLIMGIVVLEAATILGASVLYWVSRWGGHTLVLRFGRYIGVTPARLARASAMLERHGLLAVVVGRLVPTLCIVTAVVSGILELPFRRFLPALAIGGLLHLVVMVGLGYLFGPSVLRLVARLHPPLGLIASVALFGLLTYWVIRAARVIHSGYGAPKARLAVRVQAGLLAGLVAGLESSLALSSVLGLLGLTVAAPNPDVPGLRGLLEQLLTPVVGSLTAPGLPMLIVWGAAYGVAVEHELHGPAWLRGVTFAVVPLTIAVAALFPLTSWALLGAAGHDWWVPVLTEVLRHLTYGLTLGVVYGLVLRQRGDPTGRIPVQARAGA